MKTEKSSAIECKSKSAALAGYPEKVLAMKSRDVDEREYVARQLRDQLKMTKDKIIALRAHLKHEGPLQDTPTARKC